MPLFGRYDQVIAVCYTISESIGALEWTTQERGFLINLALVADLSDASPIVPLGAPPGTQVTI